MTGPNFCAKPIKSSTDAPLPSRLAAIAINWPTVTTPVPPTPVTTISHGVSSVGCSGAGRDLLSRSNAASPRCAPFFRLAPSTVTKLGQKPFRQVKSLLHVLRLIFRLRPNSVSNGSTLRQLDSTEQSPQPSQTKGLITANRLGSSILPRLRRRRFSVAQVC